jgi:hypothetical protein
MKLHFIIKEDGKLYAIPEVPERPVNFSGTNSKLHRANEDKYEAALSKAKKEALEVVNSEEVKYHINKASNVNRFSFEKDTIYSLEGCEIELLKTDIHPEHLGCDITDCLDYGKCQDSEGCKDAFVMKALITFDKSKEESQEELWNDVDNNYIIWNDQEIKLSSLIRDFELRRRK